MSDPTERVYNKVCNSLDRISESFVPEMKLTFIARLPGQPEVEMVVSEDDMDGVIEVLERRKEED